MFVNEFKCFLDLIMDDNWENYYDYDKNVDKNNEKFMNAYVCDIYPINKTKIEQLFINI